MRASFSVRTCWIAAASLLLLGQMMSPACAAEKDSLVVFPIAVSSDIAAGKAEFTAQYAEDLFVLVKEGLTAGKRFSVVAFEPRIASVQRAIREQRFTEKEVLTPIETFSGIDKARKLAALTGAQYAVIGSIDRYVFAEGKGEAELMVTFQLIDVRTGDSETIAATGRGAGAVDRGSEAEMGAGTAATYDAAEKVVAAMASAAPQLLTAEQQSLTTSEEQPSGARKSKSLIPAIIGAVLLGFLIGGS